MVNKNMNKKIQQIYKLLSTIIIMYTLFYFSNYTNNIKDKKILFILLIYMILYLYIGEIYEAFKCGKYKLTTIIYFQTIIILLINSFLFVTFKITYYIVVQEATVVNYSIVRLSDIFILILFQLILISLITFYLNILYNKYLYTKQIGIVYGSNDYKEFLNKLLNERHYFNLIYSLKDDNSISFILNKIDELDRIYLYEVNSVLRKKIILYCEKNKIEVYTTHNLDDLILTDYDSYNLLDVSFLKSNYSKNKTVYLCIKRILDIILALIGIVISLPIMIIIVLLIKIEDRGKIFYSQDRYTIDHKVFKIIKFRTMNMDAECDGKAVLAEKNDLRITQVGKVLRMTRLDELPQLFNIIKNDMSLVGPRPERPEIADKYVKEFPEFDLRLKVKAGLTGYSQVFGQYNTTTRNKLRMDLLYIKDKSFLLDFEIILITIKVIFMKSKSEGIINVTEKEAEI